MSILSIEQHFESWAAGVEADVSQKAHVFLDFFKNEEARVAEAVTLLKSKAMQILTKEGVAL